MFFSSLEEARRAVAANKGTHYERLVGIEKQVELFKWHGDIAVEFKTTYKNNLGLIIYFRTSTVKDTWGYWVPSNNQMEILATTIPEYVKTVQRRDQDGR